MMWRSSDLDGGHHFNLVLFMLVLSIFVIFLVLLFVDAIFWSQNEAPSFAGLTIFISIVVRILYFRLGRFVVIRSEKGISKATPGYAQSGTTQKLLG